MNHRFVAVCLLGLVLGSLAIPLSVSLAGPVRGGIVQISERASPRNAQMTTPLHQQVLAGRTRASGPHVRFGTVPATIVGITDNHCRFFVSTTPVDLATVAKGDPRLRPCTPTANDFQVQWSGSPTPAQFVALQRVMGDLALNHPTISLTDAEPIIRAALANVQ